MRFGLHVGLQERLWAALGNILDPFYGPWIHFGVHFGLQERLWPADPSLGAILEPFWVHFGPQMGSKKQLKNETKFKTIFDAILPFWDQIWSHFGIKFDHFWVSCGICAESPAATAPRYGFSLFSDTSDIAKPLNKLWLFDGFAVSVKVVLAIQISPK